MENKEIFNCLECGYIMYPYDYYSPGIEIEEILILSEAIPCKNCGCRKWVYRWR